jgi:hypothetical protein
MPGLIPISNHSSVCRGEPQSPGPIQAPSGHSLPLWSLYAKEAMGKSTLGPKHTFLLSHSKLCDGPY